MKFYTVCKGDNFNKVILNTGTRCYYFYFDKNSTFLTYTSLVYVKDNYKESEETSWDVVNLETRIRMIRKVFETLN